MDIKKILSQYQEALVDIRNLEAEAEELETMATSITVSTDGERVQSSGRSDSMAELATEIADIEIDIMNRRTDAIKKLRGVGKLIAAVENKNYRQLLHRRYIEGNTWERIAVEMDISYQWVCKLHGKALLEIEKILRS